MSILKVILIIPALLALVACGPQGPSVEKKTSQADKAAAAAQTVNFTENAEIDNIIRRLNLTSQPGLLGFVAIVNGIGQIALTAPVKGKITSGGKRLTKPWQLSAGDRGQYNGHFVTPGPSDEGTWGSSNPYVYFWTPSDQYIQTSMDYIYSDKPFRMTVEPLMVIADAASPEEKGHSLE